MALSDIKETLKEGLKDALEAETGLTVTAFSFTPMRLGLLFETLPSLLVDDDPGLPDVWAGPDQRRNYECFLLIEIFCDLSEDDYGEASDTLIHQMKEAAETYLVTILPELAGVRGGGRIEASKVEGFPVETSDTGILMRYGWFRLRIGVSP